MKAEIDKQMETIMNHESIKACNDAITLQAVRTGTSGYHGELLDVALKKSFQEILLIQLNDLVKYVDEHQLITNKEKNILKQVISEKRFDIQHLYDS